MLTRYELELPRDESFYTEARVFEVNLDTSACGTFVLPAQPGAAAKPFTIEEPTLLKGALTSASSSDHSSSLEDISEASMRFYRTGDITQRAFAPVEYISALFTLRYFWGLAFGVSRVNSIEWTRAPSATLHSEALKIHAEMFGYGLALSFVAKTIGISPDRFFFIAASGARADFTASVSFVELMAAGASFGALHPSGCIVEVEVKARSGWNSFRSGSTGLDLLHNLSSKAAAHPGRTFLSVLVSVPSDKKRTKTKIIIVDPNDARPLRKTEQAIVLLEESLVLLIRHGLWPTLRSALEWLQALRANGLTRHQFALLSTLLNVPVRQYRIVERTRNGITYNGRLFNDVLLRLGKPGSRRMSQDEARERLQGKNWGRSWYSGVAKGFIDIIQSQNRDALLVYGVASVSKESEAPRSGFLIEPEPIADDIGEAVRGELERALRRW